MTEKETASEKAAAQQEKDDEAKAKKLREQVKRAADPEQNTDDSVIVPRSEAPSKVMTPEGGATPDNPTIIPASTLPDNDGRQSVTIQPNPDPSVQVVYDYEEPEKETK